MFEVEVSAEGSTVVLTPTEEGLLGGLRAVLRACEASVLTLQPLLPYFSPQDRWVTLTKRRWMMEVMRERERIETFYFVAF